MLNRRIHVAHDLGYHNRNFYLIYAYFSMSEQSPLWKVFSSQIPVHYTFSNISWRFTTPSRHPNSKSGSHDPSPRIAANSPGTWAERKCLGFRFGVLGI